MAQGGLYSIVPVQEKDADDVMKLLKRTFFLDEPLNKAVGLCSSETDPCPELEEYYSHSLMEGLSFKAIDHEENIVGVMISGVYPLKEDENGNDLLSQALKCQNPKFQKILHILARTETGARLWERFPHEETMVEVKVAATDQRWRRKGIMNALLKATEKATLQRRIRLIRMDTSSAYSAMSAERHGYTCVYSALYRDIKLDGQPLIVPEPPHNEDRVYVKMLFEQESISVG
ncbi:arylalkylamine N-acetyltransferase 1-like isoform X1 [Epargyreus clarus]|uniref:arylalkylamine N-acetyltransferase 1-like isoform X1 n=1 Tax=Epargyreus clarus TaxID=520877 RepID=UPI003C2D61B6